ncbi:hypothetical protein EG329_013815 [Mollisiaceae sp. DMI_Dod_QoI]|nr:hypothetical protein EG329_013815 [Helotiales sp. DMI_Dod_QoI]
MMREDLAKGEQDLRTTLVTCLIIFLFESFHGNFPLAVAQIRTGTELIYEWRRTLPSASPAHYPSPDPTTVEDELVQAFGGFSIQTFSEPDPRPPSRCDTLKQGAEEVIRQMPATFPTLKIARAYLELIMRSATVFLSVTGAQMYSEITNHTSLNLSPMEEEQSMARLSSLQAGQQRQFEDTEDLAHQRSALSDTAIPQIADEDYISQNFQKQSSFVRQMDDLQREENLAKLRQWHQAFRSMPAKVQMKGSPGWLLLQLHYKTSIFALRSLSLDLMAYDNFYDLMLEIVTLSSRILEDFNRLGIPFFAPDLAIILPLYLVGMKCRFSSLRSRIIKLLLGQCRREGIWDSILVGKIVEWVKDVEETYMEGEGDKKRIPGWARVEPVHTSFDLLERRATVVCFQRTGPDDPLPRKIESTLLW